MTVLVAYDGSQPARNAVTHAVTEYPDDELVLLRVVEAADGSTGAGIGLAKDALRSLRDEHEETSTAEVEPLLDESTDYRVETAVGKPAREIVRFAEEHAVDAIVVGSHGREGVSRVLLGSVAEEVVRRSPVTVTVVR